MGYKNFASLSVLTGADVMAYLMNQTVIVCTSGTRPGSPTEGMVIWETDTKALKVYTSSTWRRTPVFDTETIGNGNAGDGTALGGITSTSFIPGSPVCGTTFIAPPSGGVYVTVSGRVQQNSNSFETLLGWELRAGGSVGAGTIAVSTSSARAIATGRAVVASGPAIASGSYRYRVGAGTLTAGSTYNVQTMHLVTGGTGNVDRREILVEPFL